MWDVKFWQIFGIVLRFLLLFLQLTNMLYNLFSKSLKNWKSSWKKKKQFWKTWKVSKFLILHSKWVSMPVSDAIIIILDWNALNGDNQPVLYSLWTSMVVSLTQWNGNQDYSLQKTYLTYLWGILDSLSNSFFDFYCYGVVSSSDIRKIKAKNEALPP